MCHELNEGECECNWKERSKKVDAEIAEIDKEIAETDKKLAELRKEEIIEDE